MSVWLKEALQFAKRDSSYKLFNMCCKDFASDLIKSICELAPPETSRTDRKWLAPSDGSIAPSVLELSPGIHTFIWPQDWHGSSRKLDGAFNLFEPNCRLYTTSKDGWVPYFALLDTVKANNEPGPHGIF